MVTHQWHGHPPVTWSPTGDMVTHRWHGHPPVTWSPTGDMVTHQWHGHPPVTWSPTGDMVTHQWHGHPPVTWSPTGDMVTHRWHGHPPVTWSPTSDMVTHRWHVCMNSQWLQWYWIGGCVSQYTRSVYTYMMVMTFLPAGRAWSTQLAGPKIALRLFVSMYARPHLSCAQ